MPRPPARSTHPGQAQDHNYERSQMANYKKCDAVTIRARGKVMQGKFIKSRPGAKGEYLDIDLGDGKTGSYRPSQVKAD